MKKIQHLIEYVLLRILFSVFKAAPLDIASFAGGFMARAIGPFFSAHSIAKNNISMIFPELSQKEKNRILNQMWDNLGRVAAELPHISGDTLYNYIKFEGSENIPAQEKPVIYFSGHIGNWELNYPIAKRNGRKITIIYRQANNPYVDTFINSIRATQADAMVPKGAKGSIKMLRAIKDGSSLAMLIDQKMNDGIAVPFFDRPAMTASALAELALRYDMPLIPSRVIRFKGAHFKIILYPALTFIKTGDDKADALAIMTQVNALLESWIRETPEQWFWVHKRWPTV